MGGTQARGNGRRWNLTVQTCVRLTLLAVLVATVGVAVTTHELLARRQAEQTDQTSALTLAQALATQFRADLGRAATDLQQSLDRLVEHPAVLAAAVFDQHGRRAAQAGHDVAALPGAVALADARNDGSQSAQVTAAPQPSPAPVGPPGSARDAASEPAYLNGPAMATRIAQTAVNGRHVGYRVEVDLGFHPRPERPARLVLVVAAPASQQRLSSASGFFCAVLGVAAGLVFVVASRFLRRKIVRPVRLLAEAVVGRSGGILGDARGDLDELDAVARSLASMQQDLQMWRQRVDVIERRMDSRITAETQRITRDLRQVQRQAWRDPLTGVNNRRMLEEKLPDIFAAQRDARQDLSVVMLDLDHFKQLNDTLGHAAGDKVLVFLGELLRQCLRADDLAVRYGGDEFVLILPGVSAAKALATTERITALFAQRVKMMVSIRPSPTISAGAAGLWTHQPRNWTELLKLADQGLYEAKQGGRATARLCGAASRPSLPLAS